MKELKNNIVRTIVDYNLDIADYKEHGPQCIVVDLQDHIDKCLFDEMEYEVEQSLIKDSEYKQLETEEEKEAYIENNKSERFFNMTYDLSNDIFNMVMDEFEKLGFDCYDGRFFPYEGGFKNLNDGQVAFIKDKLD